MKTMENFEELLVQAWKEVFELEEVDYDANFFELGGDSIKAVQLVGWLLQKGVKLGMMDIFTAPTINEQLPLLEETAPVYIPPSIVNKEMVKENQKTAASDPGTAPQGQQLCTPDAGAQQGTSGAAPSQLCTPQAGQQLCTPQAGQQLCTPSQLCTPQAGQQLCTPSQLCSPQKGQQLCMPNQQLCSPQVMQQLAMGIQQLCTPQAGQQLCTPGNPPQGAPDGRRPVGVIDKPVDNPNVIQVQEPHVGKPKVTPEAALDIVIKGIRNHPYGKDDNFFEIGMNSFSVMQIVTRCAEQGYRVQMQDVFQNPTFSSLVGKLKAGE